MADEEEDKPHDCTDHINPMDLLRAAFTGQVKILELQVLVTDNETRMQVAGDVSVVTVIYGEERAAQCRKMVEDITVAISEILKDQPDTEADLDRSFVRGHSVSERLKQAIIGNGPADFPEGDDAVIGG